MTRRTASPWTVLAATPDRVAGPRRADARLAKPARWKERVKLDDAGALGDFIQRPDELTTVIAYDIDFTAESADGSQHVDYSDSAGAGYTAGSLKLPAGCTTGRLRRPRNADGSTR